MPLTFLITYINYSERQQYSFSEDEIPFLKWSTLYWRKVQPPISGAKNEPSQQTNNHQAGWHTSNAIDSFLGGAPFKSRSWHMLLQLSFTYDFIQLVQTFFRKLLPWEPRQLSVFEP
jgi:hypothetical protein